MITRYEVIRVMPQNVVEVYACDDDGLRRPVQHRVRHSPTGMEFGYGGSGPADLALSILWDLLAGEPSAGLYQAFKWRFIAPQVHGPFSIPVSKIQQFIAEAQEELRLRAPVK